MATTKVDAPRAVMWSISQVVERDGVSKQAVSKSVRALADKNGLQVDRDSQGRILTFNVVQYDQLRGRFSDPSKVQAPRRREPDDRDPESYDEALRQKTWHETELKRLSLSELQGELVRKASVEAAYDRIAMEVIRILDRMPNATDELAAAVAQEGAHGLRVALRKESARLRGEIATSLAMIAAGEPETETADSEAM